MTSRCWAPAAPGQTLFRPVPFCFSPVPLPATAPAGTADRVAQRIEAYRQHLATQALERFDVLHCHDGIGANALADLGLPFVRTVHHLDPFDDPRLAAWQQRSVTAAAQVLVVSALWQQVLQRDWGVHARTGAQRRRPHALQRPPRRAATPTFASATACAPARRCGWPSAASKNARTRCGCSRPSCCTAPCTRRPSW